MRPRPTSRDQRSHYKCGQGSYSSQSKPSNRIFQCSNPLSYLFIYLTLFITPLCSRYGEQPPVWVLWGCGVHQPEHQPKVILRRVFDFVSRLIYCFLKCLLISHLTVLLCCSKEQGHFLAVLYSYQPISQSLSAAFWALSQWYLSDWWKLSGWFWRVSIYVFDLVEYGFRYSFCSFFNGFPMNGLGPVMPYCTH